MAWFDEELNNGGVDYESATHDSGRLEVGMLRGTKHEVTAEFKAGSNNLTNTIVRDEQGVLQIRLLAGPFDRSGTHNTVTHVAESQLTRQHRLDGCHPSAEVLDWSLVDFDEAYNSDSLTAKYKKVLKALYPIQKHTSGYR